MCIRNKLHILLFFCFLFAGIFDATSQTFKATINDVNGTWIHSQNVNKKNYVEEDFSWGKAKIIGESSFAIDVKEKYFFVPGGGVWMIEKISKIDESLIQIETISKSVSQKNISDRNKYRIVWFFKFIDFNHIEIDCKEQNGSEGNPYFKNYSSWYRVSGPVRK